MLNKLHNAFRFAIMNFMVGFIYLLIAMVIVLIESLIIQNIFAYIITAILSLAFYTLLCVGFMSENGK